MNELLQRHLQDLPDTAPADDLWQRVAAARQRQLRRQRGALAGGTAACLVLGLAAIGPRLMQPPVAGTPAPALAHSTEMPDARDTPAASREVLVGIDRELQLAYARNAGEDELDTLWTVRRTLAHTHSPAAQPVGI